MTAPALNMDQVSVELGGRLALEKASLTVFAGEIVGLIGPNGAGKTTLLRAALGLLAPSGGCAQLAGCSPQAERGRVGYVPQRHEFAWDFPISVEQAVLSGRTSTVGWLRRPGKADRVSASAALERVDMTDLRARPVGELSGGQRQRVLVARALALDPFLLLLDEPFTGLDQPTREVLTGLLDALRREGKAVLLTTHDLPAARDLCDRLCLLNRTVIADGPPETLQDSAVWLRAFGVTTGDRDLDAMVKTA